MASGGALYAQILGRCAAIRLRRIRRPSKDRTRSTTVGGALVIESGAIASSGNTFTSNTATERSGTGRHAGGGSAATRNLVSSGDTFNSKPSAARPSSRTAAGCTYNASYVHEYAIISGHQATGGSDYTIGGGLAWVRRAEVSNVTITGNSVDSGRQPRRRRSDLRYAGLRSTAARSRKQRQHRRRRPSAASTDDINSATISGNAVIVAAYGHGGGGSIRRVSTTILNSTISGNTVTLAGGNSGGGGILNNGGLAMTGSTVSGNTVLGSASRQRRRRHLQLRLRDDGRTARLRATARGSTAAAIETQSNASARFQRHVLSECGDRQRRQYRQPV